MAATSTIHDHPDWFNKRLHDGGPVYAETNPEQFIVEPWNAVSSLLIVLPAIWWLFVIRHNFTGYKFMLYSIPLMIMGGTGSTLYHAFRSSSFFLYMDFVPTAFLTLSLGIYFWIKVLNKWWHVFFVIILSFLIRFLFFNNLPTHTAINISYTITGIMIGLPLLLLLYRTGFYKWKYVVITIVLFLAGILFRELDSRKISFLPMGTHFLWHVFTGIGAWFILGYLYHFRNNERLKARDSFRESPH
ncbi:MAG: hypothetical protein ACNA7V_13490 [Bacteroidales bacterium]